MLELERKHLNEESMNPMGGLEFSELRYKKKEVELLHGITGYAPKGFLTAVMGPSGAGKSTLLDAMAGRIAAGSLTGRLSLDGLPLNPTLIKRTSAYVMQDDILFPMLTVYETLMFAAHFRLPSLSLANKKIRVHNLIQHLGLSWARNTMIGDEGRRGVSGGERRRVSIGVDIIHGPSLLFLDEPTSGLDSTSAHTVIEKLHHIASSGSTVILTIHQPSSRIVSLLDHLLVLGGGHLIYQGPPAHVAAYVARMGHRVPPGETPLDHLIHLITHYHLAPTGLPSYTSTSPLSGLSQYGYPSKILPSTPSVKEKDYMTPPDYGPKFSSSFLVETWTLMQRNMKMIRRTPELFLSRLLVLCVMGVMMASMFYKPPGSLQGITDRISFFIFTVCVFFFSSNDAVPAFIQERSVFLRETSFNAYRASSYVLASLLTYLPFLALQALAYALIVWFPLRLSGHFFYFFVVLYASLLSTNSFVVFVSSVVPTYILGYAAVIAFTALFFLFCGYFLNADDIPPYWKWMNTISPMTYPYRALLLNQFQSTRVFAHNPDVTGEMVLDSLGIHAATNKWVNVGIMLAWALLYRLLFYLVLRFASNNQRT